LVKLAAKTPVPADGARQPPAPTAIAPGQTEPISEPTTEPTSDPVTAPTAPAAPFASDDRGFINSNARCDQTQSALAIGRTQGSLVVICSDQNGKYEYLGVRLSDDAVLKTTAETTRAREFLARNAGVSYAVSRTELLVKTGNTVVKQEPMIEYREPSSALAEAPAR
jgi:hypothetical protein